MTMLWIAVDRVQKIPIIRQIYNQIRLSIVRGDLRAGEQLPSTRELARNLHVSRIVIVEVYDQLLAEGYLESRQGSGTYVAQGAYLESHPANEGLIPTGNEAAPLRFASAGRSGRLRSSLRLRQDARKYLEEVPRAGLLRDHTSSDTGKENRSLIDFRAGLPALELFPRKLWGQLVSRVCTEASPSIFGYEHPEGCVELRVALARYLAKTRRVRCDPDQIVITSGAAQAFSLLARLLLTLGDEVLIEDPVTYDVQRIFSTAGATLFPIPVDEDGMQTDLIPREKRPAFVFVTPSHQFPLGGLLPIQRRIHLIQFTRDAGCYLVEDDYDSEFRYSGTPVSSLQELDPERVIYVGTLSKILSPALRLGYVVLPPALIEQCRQLKRLTDLHSPVLEQLALAHFIEERHLERHILRMKKIYRKRREALITALEAHFPGQIHIYGDGTGLHLVAEFGGRALTEQTFADWEEVGVRVYPVERHAIRKGEHQSKVILGYGNLTQEEIEEGVRRIKTLLTAGQQWNEQAQALAMEE